MRLVLDTNTIVSGFLWKGPPHRLLNVAKTRRDITLHTSPKMLAELADVLSRDKLAAAVTATAVLPTLYVTIALRRFQPKAKTPVVPTLIALALAVAGVAAALLS